MPEMVLLAALLAALFGALFAIWASRLWTRARMRRRFRRARRGEIAAETLLASRGFRVLDEQVRRRSYMLVDGEAHEYEVRADLLATRRGRTYVVEVKTGAKAPKPSSSATRRQLREYAAVYEADGLVLADMSAGRLHAIEFPRQATRRSTTRTAAAFVLGAILGAALAGSISTISL